ncbi:MAG: hypothetical protein ACYTGX_00030 [Planctomycetota bacterium]|jgi:hypothetical protein
MRRIQWSTVRRSLASVLCVCALLCAAAGTAPAQDLGDEAEDELYFPSEAAEGAEAVDSESPAAPAGPWLSWTDFPVGGELWLRAEALVPFGVPSRFGDPASPVAPGLAVGWRQFLDEVESPQRTFAEISLGFASASFESDSADLADFEPTASSLAGRSETEVAYILATGRLGAELWRNERFRLLGWVGAGIALEQRAEEFRAPGVIWDDDGVRSAAVAELGVAGGWSLGRFSLQFSLSGIALLGDDPPMGAALVAGLGIGVHF